MVGFRRYPYFIHCVFITRPCACISSSVVGRCRPLPPCSRSRRAPMCYPPLNPFHYPPRGYPPRTTTFDILLLPTRPHWPWRVTFITTAFVHTPSHESNLSESFTSYSFHNLSTLFGGGWLQLCCHGWVANLLSHKRLRPHCANTSRRGRTRCMQLLLARCLMFLKLL